AERSTIAALRYKPNELEARAILLSPGADELTLRSIGIPTLAFPELPRTVRGRGRLIRMFDHQLEAAPIDLIHATGNKAALTSVVPAAARRIPLVWHKCDSWYDGRGAGLLARGCSRVLAPTKACGAGVPSQRLVVIDPVLPIDPDTPEPSHRPVATIGSIGRLEPRKGHHDVIAAAGTLRTQVPDIRLLIAGAPVPSAPHYIDTLRRTADFHGMSDRVELLGHV